MDLSVKTKQNKIKKQTIKHPNKKKFLNLYFIYIYIPKSNQNKSKPKWKKYETSQRTKQEKIFMIWERQNVLRYSIIKHDS